MYVKGPEGERCFFPLWVRSSAQRLASGPVALHMRVPPAVAVAPLPIQLPTDAPGKVVEDSPSAWALLLMWETHAEFLAPVFSLAQPWTTMAILGECSSTQKISLSLPPSLLPFK